VGSLNDLETCTLSPVRQQPAGQLMIHLVSLGENAFSNRDRQHRIVPDHVQKSVTLRAVHHAGGLPEAIRGHGPARLRTADGEP
jgi:hypothetical protein